MMKKSAAILKVIRSITREKSTFSSTKTSGQLKSPVPNYTPTPFNFNYNLELQKENAQFMLVFPDVVQELNQRVTSQYALRDVTNHLEKALEYNVPHGKKIRGLTAVLAYKGLIKNEEEYRQAYLLGWCMELLQSVFLMSDDILDQSEMRRGKPCWYKVKEVASNAVNDILLLENGCYWLLKRFFGHLHCYPKLFEMFHEAGFQTFIGQTMDFQMAQAGVTQFTMDNYILMSYHKTSHAAFYAPIALPMILAGYEDPKLFEDVKKICFDLGHFYQVQNDFLDLYSIDDTVLKKPGTDIEDGKCTWLAVKTMQYGSHAQKSIMEDCYGKNDSKCIEKVRQVYMDFDYPEMYGQYEEKIYNSLKFQIEQLSKVHNFPKSILLDTLNRTFNRD